MIDNRTTHYNLALPNVANTLFDDVGRIRSAFTDLDNAVFGKADKATTLAGYGITDSLTSGAVQTLIDNSISTLKGDAGANYDTIHELASHMVAAESYATATSNTLTAHIGSTGASHGNATSLVAGFMSATDKSNFDAHINVGGSVHANATTSVAGFMSAADKTTFNAHINAGGSVHANATTSVAGFMASADKTSLDSLVSANLDTRVTAIEAKNTPSVYSASVTNTVASMTSYQMVTQTFTITGALVGDKVLYCPTSTQGELRRLIINARVSSADTLSVYFYNAFNSTATLSTLSVMDFLFFR